MIARADRVVVDIGTGDGRAVLARAAAERGSIVVGVDASAAGMAEASRRAERARVPNALFLVAAAEALVASPLVSCADLVTVTMPWGSLLRGVLGMDSVAFAGVRGVLSPGGQLEVLLSVADRDGLPLAGLSADDGPRIVQAWAETGLDLCVFRPATTAEISRSASTWARRLLRGGRPGDTGRPVWLLAGAVAPSPVTRRRG